MRGSVKVWVLAFVVAAGVGFGGRIGVGCLVGANVCPGSHDAPLTTNVGSEIFAARCAQCHGARAEGGTGPTLIAGEAASLSLPELIHKIEKGRPFYGMPAFRFGSRKLTPAQIDAVARYVFQLRGGR